jgi:predicted amidophosphoribosyltransferase
MVKCADCGKEIPKDEAVYCDMCGASLCKECGAAGLCSNCTELWITEIDLEDMEAEENTRYPSLK